MCGIAGFAGLRATGEGARSLITAMGEAIRHRGPDGGGVTVHDDVAIGMVRLAIVDVEHGAQPMYSSDRQIALVYNGEIYNAPALRKQLTEEGIHFETRSDTEVILRLYEKNPETVEEHLVGMWAFAIHDRRRKRLLLSRDRFGIKPLFVTSGGGALAFSSELGALALTRGQGLGHCFTIDHGSAHAMLSYAYIPNEDTIYEGVKRLAPATRLDIDLATGRRTARCYWTLNPCEDAARVASLDDACAFIEPLLRRSVKEHLESDVPIAAFLSGGIDSSLVLAYALEHGSVKPFTIGFRERAFDESPFAREVARALGVEIQVEMLDEAAARAAVPEALAAYDEPFGDSSSLASYLLAKVVAKSHKVALGGDGGDEVFAGYKKHRIISLRSKLDVAPRLRQLASAALLRLPSRTDRTTRLGELLRTARRLGRGLSGSDAVAYVALTQVGAMEKTAPLVVKPGNAARFAGPVLRAFADAERRAPRGQAQLFGHLSSDMSSPLPNDMLVKVDRATMARHLEARVPFLDHRVAEAGVGLRAEYTLGRGGKAVLRELYRRKFGDALANRRKQGFGVPVEKWLRGHLVPACDRLFEAQRLDRHGILRSDTLGHGRWRTWAANDPQILWHAFALAAWCERWLGDGPPALLDILSPK